MIQFEQLWSYSYCGHYSARAPSLQGNDDLHLTNHDIDEGLGGNDNPANNIAVVTLVIQ
jgi:hypothetical protein